MPCRNPAALCRPCGDSAGAGAGAGAAPSDERNPWAPRAGCAAKGDLAAGAAAYAGAGAPSDDRAAATGTGAGAGLFPRPSRKDAAVLGRDESGGAAAAVARVGLAAAVVVGRDGL